MIKKYFWHLRSRIVQVCVVLAPALTVGLATLQDYFPMLRDNFPALQWVLLNACLSALVYWLRIKTANPINDYKPDGRPRDTGE